jgi:hypothetical protein
MVSFDTELISVFLSLELVRQRDQTGVTMGRWRVGYINLIYNAGCRGEGDFPKMDIVFGHGPLAALGSALFSWRPWA